MTVPGQNSDTPCRIHTYIQPELRKLQRCPIDHSLPQWRRQFSQLERAQAMNDLNCPLMHINASITLKHGLPPHDAELWGRFEIVIPPHEANLEWRCMQTLTKHKDLYGAAESDPPITNKMYPLNIDRIENGVGPIVRVGFPAMTWAHAMSRLSDIQEEFEKSRREGSHFPVPMTAREYVEQMTMYQEIYSSAGEGQEWKKRAVICWTFTKAKQGELNFTSWRYVDVVPQRRMLMSPHPGAHQEMQAQMSENFNAIYTNSQPLSIQPPTPYDNVFPGLTTPPGSAVLQSPFSQYGYPSGHQSSQDLVPENMSSISQHTVSSDGHMDHHHQQAAQTMNHYLGSDPINPSYPQYDSAPQQMWQPPQVPVQQYEFQDSGYMSQPYTAMPSQGEVQVQVWDQDAARWGSTDTQAYPSYEMGPPKMR
jgi:transcriptional enhancer factor